MGKGVQTTREHGEAVRVHLLSQGMIAHGCRILQKEGGVVIFPVKDSISIEHLQTVDGLASIVECDHIVPDNFAWNTLEKNLEGLLDEKGLLKC